MKQKTEEKPQEMVVAIGTRTWYVTINFNITKVEDGYEFDTATVVLDHALPFTEADYGLIVSTLIRSRYSQDQVEAITQNYLADPEGYKQEFGDLQVWRAECKELARSVLDTPPV